MISNSGQRVEDADEYTSDQLCDDYGWIWIDLRDDADHFQAANWVWETAGVRDQDWTYRSVGVWLIRDHAIAALFKLRFG